MPEASGAWGGMPGEAICGAAVDPGGVNPSASFSM